MGILKVSLAFIRNDGEDKELIGVFSCLKNALAAVKDQELLMASIEDGESILEVYSMPQNTWFDLDDATLEFSTLNEEDRDKLFN